MTSKVFSVEKITAYIKNILTNDYLLKNVVVEGEVTGVSKSRGHIYFDIKDEKATLGCVMWASKTATGLKFDMQNGMKVRVTGSIDVYAPWGNYKLYANTITEAGEGDQKAKLEKLRAMLMAEGLFDAKYKKAIPEYPKSIGIVTAADKDAIEDLKNNIWKRNPYIKIIHYPSQVQGKYAAESICKGIKALDNYGVDIIIIGRGGGSAEDLSAFDNEAVVRAVFNANTPLITATGHTKNQTLADLAADYAADTPTEAAVKATKNIFEVIDANRLMRERLYSSISHKLDSYKKDLLTLRARIDAKSPSNMLKHNRELLENYKKDMNSIINNKVLVYSQKYEKLSDGLSTSMDKRFDNYKNKFQILVARLDGLSPTKKLVGGFGYIESEHGPLVSVDSVSVDDGLTIKIKDGTVDAVVTDVTKGDI